MGNTKELRFRKSIDNHFLLGLGKKRWMVSAPSEGNQDERAFPEPVGCDVVAAMRAWRGEYMVAKKVGTNLWHPDLGLRFPGAVEQREAYDGQQMGSVSAWRLRIRGVVGLVSVLARDCPMENGVWVSPLEGWRQADTKETG